MSGKVDSVAASVTKPPPATPADGIRDTGTSADRRQLHDHPNDTEQRLKQGLDHRHEWLAALTDRNQCVADEHRDQDDLQHRTLREGISHRLGNDVHEEIDDAVLLASRRLVFRNTASVERRNVDVHADARLHHIDDHQADHQRERRNDLEVDQRPDTDAADFLYVPHLRDTEDHGAEDDRCKEHLNELDERIGKRLKHYCYVGEYDPDERTDSDANQYLYV